MNSPVNEAGKKRASQIKTSDVALLSSFSSSNTDSAAVRLLNAFSSFCLLNVTRAEVNAGACHNIVAGDEELLDVYLSRLRSRMYRATQQVVHMNWIKANYR